MYRECVPVVVECNKYPSRCEDISEISDSAGWIVYMLQNPVDPACVKGLVMERDLQEIAFDERTPCGRSNNPLPRPGDERCAGIQPDNTGMSRQGIEKAGEVNTRTTPGIKDPSGPGFCDDPDTVAFDLLEERDTGDQVQTPGTRSGVPGCVDIAKTCGKGLAGGIVCIHKKRDLYGDLRKRIVGHTVEDRGVHSGVLLLCLGNIS